MDRFDLCEVVLEAAARDRRLRELHLRAPAAALFSRAGLERLKKTVRGGALSSVEHLKLLHPYVPLSDVSALAALPVLKYLKLSSGFGPDPLAQGVVAAEHVARGLTITFI